MKLKYNENFPKILKKLNCSLAITSYQSDKLLFLKTSGIDIHINSYKFKRPMGLYIDNNKLIIGTHSHVFNFKRSSSILKQIKQGSLNDEARFSSKILEKDREEFEKFKIKRQTELKNIKQADALFVPKEFITTGMINIHDISLGKDKEVWMVNSTFSCLATLDYQYSFISRWKPPFISDLVPEDRCHLNGMAMVNGKPKYVTTFNTANEKDFWKKETEHNGTLIDIETNKILLKNLIMPHSPKYYQGDVYLCESGKGTVLKFNPKTKKIQEIVTLQGFTRGISFYKSFMFIGLSKMRASYIKNPIPLTKMYKDTFSGIWIIDLKTNQEVAYLQFNDTIDQIYEVAIIENSTNPELLDNDNGLIQHIFDYKEMNYDFS